VTKDRPRNMAASVRQRLINQAREKNEAFDQVLIRYAVERLLYRLSQSPHRDRFVLKGAMLFQIWSGQSHRPTRDLDLLGTGDPAPADLEQVFRGVCDQDVEDDGLRFLADSVHADRMKEEEEYEGLRLKFQATLASARIQVQIDIGFGDAVTPSPQEITYPTLLDFAAPVIKAYPKETVVAEKYQAMVMLGIANSRMKDFYDIWTLAEQYSFSGAMLSEAIRATFGRRRTPLPESLPFAFTEEFTSDAQKVSQWQAFLRKGKLGSDDTTLPNIAVALQRFLMPPTKALVGGTTFDMMWPANGPWQSL
jgi:predicted nucleotidyltransferase component of viral defense system